MWPTCRKSCGFLTHKGSILCHCELGENKKEVAKVENQSSKRVRMKRKSCFKSIKEKKVLLQARSFLWVFHSPGMTEMEQMQRKEKCIS